jgi:NADH-quinone oxidoreductase subunit L
MSDEQDMRKMGGIWHLIPSTYILMWVGSLALAGMPFFAGYYSKDMILETAFADHTWFGTMAYWFGIVAALLTAFYSWRLILMTFHGKPRADEKVMAHVHESPLIMLLPLTVLAAGAILAGSVFYGGFVGSPNAAGHANDILNMTGLVNVWDKMHFWGSSIFVLPENDTVEAAHHVPHWVKVLPIFVASAGIILAYIFYMFAPKMPSVMVKVFKPIHALFYNKWFFDELYDRVFTRNAFRLGQFFWQKGDKAVIDGYGPDGVASVYARFAGVLSRFQTGYVFQYAFVMMIGLIGLVSWFVFRATMGQ